jgi:outer membrane protein assembly factor BamB
MSKGLRSFILIFSAVILIGCVGGKSLRWSHFHGDPANLGFQAINSGFALSSSWISNPYRITSSSPVIGQDYQGKEVLYIGTTHAKLIALRSENGTEKWQRPLGGADASARIVSSASVSDKGDIYIIVNRMASDGLPVSTLHKVDQFGNPKWSYRFPDHGYTTGSPKVITSPNATLIFVYVSVGMPEDIQGELFVLRDDRTRSQLLDRKALGTCRFDVSGGRARSDDILGAIKNSWNALAGFPVEFDGRNIVLPETFVDPTIAFVTGREKPLIAIADNLCSIGAFEWDGAELSILWRHDHNFDQHSSAAVLPNGLMVFGGQDGKVLAYDVQTGVKMWEYDAGQTVFATPAAASNQFVFVVSKDQIQVISAADGALIRDDTFSGKLPLLGSTHSSPAVTVNRVYVSTLEMLTVTHDLKTRGHDTNFHGNGLSSVAIGRDGAVYGVAVDGTIRKYAGTE